MRGIFIFFVALFANWLIAEEELDIEKLSPETLEYLPSSIYTKGSFFEISDPFDQAMQWANCAAAYNMLAELITAEFPAKSEHMKGLSRGAAASILGAIMIDYSPDEVESFEFEVFNAKWRAAQRAGNEWPEQQAIWIVSLAEGEENESEILLRTIISITAVCMKNNPEQTSLVKVVRHLMASGLLKEK